MRFAWVAALLLGCSAVPTRDPNQKPGPSYEPVDAGATPDAGTACEQGCAEHARLGCKEAEKTPKGMKCPDVCERALVGGIQVVKDLACMRRATTCEQARACNRRRL